jgi:hypothetical protein
MIYFSTMTLTRVFVTRSQSAAAERLAAERQVSVDNDNNDTDFGEVCSSAENAASESLNSLKADNHSYANLSLLNGDIITVPIESVIDRHTLVKLQKDDESLAKFFETTRETTDAKSSERFFLSSLVF